MRKSLILCASLLVLSAGSVWAAGLNLAWNECPAGGGTATRTFACNTNSGTNVLFCTFVAPAGVLACSGIAGVIDVQTGGATPSLWWSVRGTVPAGCRSASLSSSADFTLNSACTDYWAGLGNAAVSEDDPSGTGNRVRIKLLCALPAGSPQIGPIAEGTEVYAISVRINNAKTVGTGACAGCLDEACLVLNEIDISQPVEVGLQIPITTPAVAQHVIWQGWTNQDPAQLCPNVTPAKQKTWGSIKALYR